MDHQQRGSSEVSLGTSASKLTATKIKREATRKHAVLVAGLGARDHLLLSGHVDRRKGSHSDVPATGSAPATLGAPKADTKKPTSTAPSRHRLARRLREDRVDDEGSTTGTVDLGGSAKKLTTPPESESTRRHSLLVTDLAPGALDPYDLEGCCRQRRFEKEVPLHDTSGRRGRAGAWFRRGETTGQATVDARLGSVTLAGGSTKSRRGVSPPVSSTRRRRSTGIGWCRAPSALRAAPWSCGCAPAARGGPDLVGLEAGQGQRSGHGGLALP